MKRRRLVIVPSSRRRDLPVAVADDVVRRGDELASPSESESESMTEHTTPVDLCVHCRAAKRLAGRRACNVCRACALRPLRPPFSHGDIVSLDSISRARDWATIQQGTFSAQTIHEIARRWRCWKCSKNKGVVGPFTFKGVQYFDRRCQQCACCPTCGQQKTANGGTSCTPCAVAKLNASRKARRAAVAVARKRKRV